MWWCPLKKLPSLKIGWGGKLAWLQGASFHVKNPRTTNCRKHAARKWLQGESIPTQEKLRALAGWLDVPADWLRFGNGDTRKGGGADTSMTDQRATALLSQLDEHHRQIGLDMLRGLVRTYKKR